MKDSEGTCADRARTACAPCLRAGRPPIGLGRPGAPSSARPAGGTPRHPGPAPLSCPAMSSPAAAKVPDAQGHFGPYGGRFVPETLMHPLQELERAATEVLVNQLDIARQCIEDRDRRIWELEKRTEILEGMLNRLAARQNGVPAPQPQPAFKPVPKRWAVR